MQKLQSFEAPFFFLALRYFLHCCFLLATVHRYIFMGQDWGCLRYETQYEGSYYFKGCSYMSGMQDERMEHQQISVPSAPALPRGHSLWLIGEPACCWLDCCSAAGLCAENMEFGSCCLCDSPGGSLICSLLFCSKADFGTEIWILWRVKRGLSVMVHHAHRF